MNSFTQKKSLFFFLYTWLFIAALFADAANLDDLMPSTIVLHSDEDSVSLLSFGLSFNTPQNCPAMPFHSPKNRGTTHKVLVGGARIIYDQDSSSLAAGPMLASELITLFLRQKEIQPAIPQTTSLLHIRFSTLLI
jgi:hypothetical protein